MRVITGSLVQIFIFWSRQNHHCCFSDLRHVSELRPFSVFLYRVPASAARFASAAPPGLLEGRKERVTGHGLECTAVHLTHNTALCTHVHKSPRGSRQHQTPCKSVLCYISSERSGEVAFLKPKCSGLLLKKVENNEQTQCQLYMADGKRLCDHDVTRLW